MSFNESQAYPVYFAYKDAQGPALGLMWPAVLINAVAIPGMFMNGFVVFVTLIRKSLHGTSNYLLALMCFFEMLHQSGHLIFLVVSLSGINFIRVWTSILWHFPMIVGFNAALIGMPLAAFDRLFYVLVNEWHTRMKQCLYLLVLTLLCVFYGLYFYWYIFTTVALQMPDAPVSGCITDVMAYDKEAIFMRYTLIFNVISILCYALIWVLIRRQGGTKETNTRLLKSLLLIITVNIGAYLVSVSIYRLFYILMQIWDFLLLWHLSYISGVSLNLGAACNAPILYLTSTEYRKAFIYYLRVLCCKSKSANNFGGQVFPLKTVTHAVPSRRLINNNTATMAAVVCDLGKNKSEKISPETNGQQNKKASTKWAKLTAANAGGSAKTCIGMVGTGSSRRHY